MTSFLTLTACGEDCTHCGKKQSGICPGCNEAEGRVPEWEQSGVCRVYACVKRHGAHFCGMCGEFPCKDINKIIPWNADIIAHLAALRKEYIMQKNIEIEIRPVTEELAQDFGNIVYTSWEETYRGLIPDEVLDGRSLEVCIEKAREHAPYELLAYVGGKAVGAVYYLPETRDICSNKGGEIVALYVLKDYQRMGIGSALMSAVFDKIGRHKLTLFVLKGNENAVCFYQKKGFAFTGKQIRMTGMTDLEMYRA